RDHVGRGSGSRQPTPARQPEPTAMAVAARHLDGPTSSRWRVLGLARPVYRGMRPWGTWARAFSASPRNGARWLSSQVAAVALSAALAIRIRSLDAVDAEMRGLLAPT